MIWQLDFFLVFLLYSIEQNFLINKKRRNIYIYKIMKVIYNEEMIAPRIMMQSKTYKGKPLPVWIDDVIEYCQGDKIHEIVKKVREADALVMQKQRRQKKQKPQWYCLMLA